MPFFRCSQMLPSADVASGNMTYLEWFLLPALHIVRLIV